MSFITPIAGQSAGSSFGGGLLDAFKSAATGGAGTTGVAQQSPKDDGSVGMFDGVLMKAFMGGAAGLGVGFLLPGGFITAAIGGVVGAIACAGLGMWSNSKKMKKIQEENAAVLAAIGVQPQSQEQAAMLMAGNVSPLVPQQYQPIQQQQQLGSNGLPVQITQAVVQQSGGTQTPVMQAAQQQQAGAGTGQMPVQQQGAQQSAPIQATPPQVAQAQAQGSGLPQQSGDPFANLPTYDEAGNPSTVRAAGPDQGLGNVVAPPQAPAATGNASAPTLLQDPSAAQQSATGASSIEEIEKQTEQLRQDRLAEEEQYALLVDELNRLQNQLKGLQEQLALMSRRAA